MSGLSIAEVCVMKKLHDDKMRNNHKAKLEASHDQFSHENHLITSPTSCGCFNVISRKFQRSHRSKNREVCYDTTLIDFLL